MDPARVASRFDVEYYGKLMEKAWGEVAFGFEWIKSGVNSHRQEL